VHWWRREDDRDKVLWRRPRPKWRSGRGGLRVFEIYLEQRRMSVQRGVREIFQGVDPFFEEHTYCELPLRASVNKAPADAPSFFGWQHQWCHGPLQGKQLGKGKKSVSTEDENKASFRRYIEEAWNQGNLEVVDEIFDRYISHQPDGSTLQRGPEDVKRFVGEFRTAFPDLRLIIEEQIAEGDKVVSRGTIRGTHQREFRGMAPTGEEVDIPGTAVFRFSSEGKVVESWDAYDQLSLMRQSIEQELRVARRIQQASLPKEMPQLEGWEISPHYRPAREVGGDFYDFHLLSEGKLGLVVGDATGKGVPAALVMSTTCGMLQLAAQALGSSSPGELLGRVNETLFARIPPNMFVTCFYGVLDPKSGTFTYANAGHDLPYLHSKGDTKELRARGMPLGLMPGMGYEEKEVILQADEAVLFYSDGLVEAHNRKGEMFGFPRLRALVAEHGEERPLEEALLEELYSFVGESWEQEDDITLLTLQRSKL
jgi:serine phosphatase RsbU (regulator of sigma subunit)